MSRGYDRFLAKNHEIAALGRSLSRRARSRCEICDAKQVKLVPWMLPPKSREVDIDGALFLCEQCIEGVTSTGELGPRWRLLELSAWSESSTVQAVSVNMLKRISDPWAQDLVDTVYMSPEAEEILAEIQ